MRTLISVCISMCVCMSLCFARCVYLAAMSSPFNIIFTIQSHYTSYSFMSSHINDFIMLCAVSFSLIFYCIMFSVFVIGIAKDSKRNMSYVSRSFNWCANERIYLMCVALYACSKLNDIIIDKIV